MSRIEKKNRAHCFQLEGLVVESEKQAIVLSDHKSVIEIHELSLEFVLISIAKAGQCKKKRISLNFYELISCEPTFKFGRYIENDIKQ